MKYALLLALAFLQVIINAILWHKRHSRVSQILTYFTGSLLIWTIFNTILDYATFQSGAFASQQDRLIILNISNRLGFLAGALILIILYRLILIFPVEREHSNTTKYITITGLIVALGTLSSFVSGYYKLDASDQASYVYGPGVVIVVGYFLLVAVMLFRGVMQSLRRPLEPQVRKQAKSIIFALIATGIWAIFFILVLPGINHAYFSMTFIGYFAPYIFNTVLLYSIVKQGFLNFQLIVARSMAYALSLGFMIALFIFLTFGSIRLISGGSITLMQALIFAALNIVTALSFQPLKKFFNRVTNSIFYRDAYDSQELLDNLNRLFVSSTDLQKLLQETVHTLQETLKVSYCYFILAGVSGSEGRVIGKAPRMLSATDMAQAHAWASTLPRKVIATDELNELKKTENNLGRLLSDNLISVLGRLSPSTARSSVNLGYLCMGPRRSGNPYTAQDLRVLEIIVNELVIATENSMRFEEVQHFNETLQENVNDATRKLRRTNEKLKALDATKDEFITMASHQLRTPLTSVKGYLSMVLEGDAGKLNKQQIQLLEQSYASAQRMVYLISDLLNLSRLNTGKFVIESTPVDLRDVVQAEISQLRETAKSRDVILDFSTPETFPKLLLDETKIHQVVMNFIDNAIYYTPAGGSIAVGLRETPTFVEYTVKDTGIGVPKTEQHKLFTKFYRAGNARQARPDGTGLGLFMAKKVIAAQGGAIIFDSHEGKGSTFGFRFDKAHHLAPGEYTLADGRMKR